MDDMLNKIARLERELREKEDTLILSATIGKDLLEQNEILNSKLEETQNQNQAKLEKLEQENYGLTMRYQAKEATLNSLSSELEHIESLNNLKNDQLNRTHQEEINKLNDKISSQSKLLELLEEEKNTKLFIIDELQVELKNMLDKCHEDVIHELSASMSDDSLQLQLVSIANEKDALDNDLKIAQRNLQQSQMKISFLEESAQQNREELEYKECEVTSLYNIVEKKKTEIEELQVEIENMNIEKIDPKKRGNSLFAEVEDNRKLVERKYLFLKDSFMIQQKQFQSMHEQNHRLRKQLASLLAQSANRGSLEYQEDLQNMVNSLTSQLQVMATKCKKLEEENSNIVDCPCLQKDMTPGSVEDGFRQLYKQEQKKTKDTENKISELMLAKVYLTDRIVGLQKKINMASKSKDSLSAEVIRLRVKLEECGVELDEDNSNRVLSQRAEKLPFFDEIQRRKAKIEEESSKKESSTTSAEEVSSQAKTCQVAEENVTGDATKGEIQKETSDKSLTNDNLSEDKENLQNIPNCQIKKPRTVHFSDNTTDNKKEEEKLTEDIPAIKRPKKKLRKMEGPHIVVGESKPEEQCKQQ